MTGKIKPCMDILPPAQKRLWPELRNAQHLGFTLYGGTAIALRLGHRESVDFDFFSEKPLDREAIKAAFPFMGHNPAHSPRASCCRKCERKPQHLYRVPGALVCNSAEPLGAHGTYFISHFLWGHGGGYVKCLDHVSF